jgi:hypothetical protein
MTIVIPEGNSTLETTAGTKKPKANKKPRVARRRPNVASAKAKSAHGARLAKKGPPSRPRPHVTKSKALRDASKTAKMLDLLKRTGGATSKELMKASGWLPHSVRGFLSGMVSKKMGLTVISTKGVDGERTYSVEA